MKCKIIIRIFSLIITFGIMLTIFLFSSQSGDSSNQLSISVVEILLGRLIGFLSPDQIQSINLVLRKMAHFSLYAVMGFGMMSCCLTMNWKKKLCFVISILICGLFASCDEWRQFLSGTRNGNIRDVLLDCCGAVVGCFISMLCVKFISYLIEKRKLKYTQSN